MGQNIVSSIPQAEIFLTLMIWPKGSEHPFLAFDVLTKKVGTSLARNSGVGNKQNSAP